MKKQPNLFDYATSELSQDAFICWLLSWADPAHKATHPEMHARAVELLRAFFDKHGLDFPPEITSIQVLKQDANVDVLCILNETYALLIEDKTHSSEHSDQLQRYFDQTKRKFSTENILPIYFKTRDQSSYVKVRAAGYQTFLREDLLAILNRNEAVANDIFQDFRINLEEIDQSVQSFRHLPLDKWDRNSWVGFYVQMQKAFPNGAWDYVANPAGGFLGFWFSWHQNAYLQLEQSKFCFKIEVDDPVRQSEERRRWHEAIMATGTAAGFKIRKPDRFGAGTYMTVCVLNEEYRKIKAGVLDLEATVAFIKDISTMLKSVHLP